MGIQHVKDVTLIRHAYVPTKYQGRGVGANLLKYLISRTHCPEVLGETWRASSWAIQFYKTHGFSLTSSEETNRLLGKYWDIPERQIEISVVQRFIRK